MAIKSIALSADNKKDLVNLQQNLRAVFPEAEFQRESLFDLLLCEQLAWYRGAKVPDLIVAAYRENFHDLKAVVELRKNEKFKLVPILLLLKENYKPVEELLRHFGVSAVRDLETGF